MDDVYDTGVAARAGFVTDARADTRAAEEANLNLNLPSGPLATTNLNVTNLNLNIPSGSLTPVDPTLADLFAAGDDDQSDYQSIKNIVMLGPNGECIEGGGGGGGGGGDGGLAGVHGTADPAAAGPATAPPPRPPKSKMAPLPPRGPKPAGGLRPMSLPGTGATFKPGGTASLPANVSLSELSMEAKMLELQLREAKGKAARKKKKAGGYLMEEREAGGPNTAELIAADSVHAHKNRLSANLDSAIYGNGAVGRQVPGSMMPRSPDVSPYRRAPNPCHP